MFFEITVRWERCGIEHRFSTLIHGVGNIQPALEYILSFIEKQNGKYLDHCIIVKREWPLEKEV